MSSRMRVALAVTTALAVAAAACAGWFGWSWLSAANAGSLAEAQTRDAVLQQAERGVVNLTSFSYRDAAQGVRVWLASSTGKLHADLAKNRQQEVKLIQKDKTITTAKILEGAVTQLAVGPGTATVMLVVEVTVTQSGQAGSPEAESEVAQLQRGRSGWKLSSLGSPPGTSPSPSASPTP
jgi:Mce-associated membrane protein